jgi:GNAT superfamily N-acetyltransferase
MSERIAVGGEKEVLIRPISPDDKAELAAAFDRLSPESRYRRFFAPLERLSTRDLAYLTEVDHHDHEAVVAVEPGSARIVGVARYVRDEDPAEAEVAVVVADPWQGLGVGSALLERLVERAREEDIRQFVAIVLSDNADALELFRSMAPDSSWIRRTGSGQSEMLIELPEAGALSGSRLGRVLSAVAREGLRVNPWTVLRRAILRRPTEEMKLPQG